MRNMIKRGLILFVTIVMMTGLFGASTFADEITTGASDGAVFFVEQDDEIPVGSEADELSETDEPLVTEEPSEADELLVTEESSETDEPLATEEPSETDELSETEADTTSMEEVQDESEDSEQSIDEDIRVNVQSDGNNDEQLNKKDNGTGTDADNTSKAENSTEKKDAETKAVKKITLNKNELTLEKSKTGTLIATVMPEDADNKNVKWTSSNEKVATVDKKGRVLAVKAGETKITATTEDGNLSATCKVTVVVTATGLKLDKKSAVMATKSTLVLKPSFQPADATKQDIIWSSSDEKIATVDKNGKVTALRYGKVTITAALKSDPKKKAECKIETRFYDVNGSAVSGESNYQYFYTPVYWAANKGITQGYDNVYFGPKKKCTRKEMIIFLWRLSGKPSASGGMPFNDSKYAKGTDSYKAILWGSKKGIIKGYSGKKFKPNDTVSRKDALIMLYRLAGKPKVSGNMLFNDVIKQNYRKGSDTYRAILWAYYKEITNGYDDGSFRPKSACLREHIVTFIYRYRQNASKKTYLAAPKNVAIKKVSGGLKITFSKVSGASSYDICRWIAADKKWRKIGTTTSTSYTYKGGSIYNAYTIGVLARTGRVRSDNDKTGMKVNGETYRFMDGYLGISRENVVKQLEAHERDSYYRGAPCIGLERRNSYGDPYHTYGSDDVYGVPGYNCTGFVWRVLYDSGANKNYIPIMRGVYKNCWNNPTEPGNNTWWAFIRGHQGNFTPAYYRFDTVSQLLKSGKAEKGDVIYMLQTGEPSPYSGIVDSHCTIFYGNTPSDNRLFHSGPQDRPYGTRFGVGVSTINAGSPSTYYLIKWAPGD